jgi:cytochrome c-type biogenesis protein CcmH
VDKCRDRRRKVASRVARYGDFVLYKPPVKGTTALLWAGPALLALVGLALGWRAVARAPREAAAPEDTA